MNSLVQKLFEGEIDIIGDVHGDIEALRQLLKHLGYNSDGSHADDRRLVFVGDLTDRGPASPAVISLVQRLIESGKAQCTLGNHELNILLNQRKFDNGWFFGEAFHDQHTGELVHQQLADETLRNEILDFFGRLPLVLQRDDARVVHACWQPEMVAMASEADDVLEFYEQHRFAINLGLAIRTGFENWQQEQRHQNLNPVKVLTSGLEIKVDEPFEASGEIRYLERYPWWEDYADAEYCFFGHYSRSHKIPRGDTRAICVDYGVGKRWVSGDPNDRCSEKWRLAAVRYPEMQVVFDHGETEKIVCTK